MYAGPVTRLHASLLGAALLAACSTDSASGADGQATKLDDASAQKASTADVNGPAALPDGTALGQLRATEHINLNALVNKTPDQVDAALGEALAVGSDRVSCVRFLPERVFFACEQEIRTYTHAYFQEIRVEFEDGHAASVALIGFPGTGSFSSEAALQAVGLTLPEAPRHDNPPLAAGEGGEVVDRWEWSNSRARLLVDGLEHRVRLSVVNSDWARAKLEVINNSPLTPDQQGRVKQPKNTPVPATATESSPAGP